MTHPVQIELLRCPATGGKLEWMEATQLLALRDAIDREALVSRGGELVTQQPESVLVCGEAGLGYMVLDGIPVLVPDQAISLGQLLPLEGLPPTNPQEEPHHG